MGGGDDKVDASCCMISLVDVVHSGIPGAVATNTATTRMAIDATRPAATTEDMQRCFERVTVDGCLTTDSLLKHRTMTITVSL
mmetsp:Transcript_25368/g.47273  ORF Transcript_25368/g.47273 Transcript_25368/m.47273 type:complete len:83 (-) Transcript_25368:44-292(-)